MSMKTTEGTSKWDVLVFAGFLLLLCYGIYATRW